MNKISDEDCCSIIDEVLTIIGGKWAFLVIGHLNKGALRFNQLQRNINTISAQSLTKTLKHLEKSGMIYRHALPTVPVTVEYSLTDKGQDFQSILEEIRDWGQKWEKENRSNSTK